MLYIEFENHQRRVLGYRRRERDEMDGWTSCLTFVRLPEVMRVRRVEQHIEVLVVDDDLIV